MQFLYRLILSTLTVVAGQCFTGASEPVSFTRDIRPILSDNCFACHGPDEDTREADLRLDVAESAVDSGSISPGEIDQSEVWARINSSDPDAIMPPPGSHEKLSDSELDLIRRWIISGAEYRQHWSFVAPTKRELPKSDVTHPIDAFLRDRLKAEGLEPAPLADRRTLIRRVTLDLTGLPPTPEEVEAFVSDQSDDAYEQLIEGLMDRVTY
jgi:hypothetical protein